MLAINLEALIKLGNTAIALGAVMYIVSCFITPKNRRARSYLPLFSVALVLCGLLSIQFLLRGLWGVAIFSIQSLVLIFAMWLFLRGKDIVYLLAFVLLSFSLVFNLLGIKKLYDLAFEVFFVFLAGGIIVFSSRDKNNENQ